MMLTELQHFCIDAMGLSHGITPPTKPLARTLKSSTQKSTSSAPAPNAELKPFNKITPNISEQLKETTEKTKQEKQPQTSGIAPKQIPIENWEQLETAISTCHYCSDLVNSRSQAVFGQGNKQAQLMIIGEPPHQNEDIQNAPFVEQSGELLEHMLKAINIQRNDTFTTNVIKCLTPNNRSPHVDEAKACQSFLNAQIKLLQPTLILALGRVAAHYLLNVKTPVNQLRGTIHQHEESQTPIIVSYHPDYLLRNPKHKQHSWNDLKLVHQQLNK